MTTDPFKPPHDEVGAGYWRRLGCLAVCPARRPPVHIPFPGQVSDFFNFAHIHPLGGGYVPFGVYVI